MTIPSPDIEIDIAINDERWNSEITEIEAFTQNIVQRVLSDFEWKTNNIDISIVLADNDFIQELNKNYRHKDKPTNVLSFPQTENEDLNNESPFISLGDIIVALETIKAEASEQNKSFSDHYTHMLIHGCLHLLHYDHITDEQAAEMEGLEIEILNTLNIKNPYE